MLFAQNIRCFVALFVLLLAAAFAVLQAVADDWPQWRGPERADRSPETGLLQQWSEGGPDRLWLFDKAGLGYAGFAIAGDRVFTMGLEDGAEFALCLNAETGKEIWRKKIGNEFENSWGNGPRSTPTVDGDFIYLLSARGNLCCLKVRNGGIVWKKDLAGFGGRIPEWGYAESPLVDGKTVYCTPGGSQGAIVALNKKEREDGLAMR